MVLYVAFRDAASEQAYYEELLSLNGMAQNKGACASQTLVPAPHGPYGGNSYCENASPLRGSASSQGRVFLFDGPQLNLDTAGDSLTASHDCSFANDKQVVAFTDPNYTAIAIAENCTSNSYNLGYMYSDFSNGKLDLGS